MIRPTSIAPCTQPLPRRVLVLACGNTLRGDDGVGQAIGQFLKSRPPPALAEIVITQQLLPEHAELLSQTDAVIFVDCSASAASGIVSSFAVESAKEPSRAFTHHLTPSSLLQLCRELYEYAPDFAVTVTVGGEHFALSEALSPAVQAAIPAAVKAIDQAIENSYTASHLVSMTADH